ncbi:tellurite resistance TerB family protein [uncultured Cohaesibacter sp.]|uniref:tellurite resistance TerB family protein n=1 Tax=uncultured Cohaesibacter sp. TaxID=1002546 RepID=UPI00292CAA79|nr:tellurite resistance TerB family protein [uncultured Cohaesibacter sp.]
MFDASKIIGEFLGSSSIDADDLLRRGTSYLEKNAGGIGGGAIAGSLAGLVLGTKGGRKFAKNASTYGGLALIAGLAYKAYSDYQGKTAGVPIVDGKVGSDPKSIPASLHVPEGVPQVETHVPVVPMGSGFEINEMTERASGFGATLVSAMIAAAKADGQIDAEEQKAIFEKIGEEKLSAEEKAFLLDQLSKPLDIDSLVSQAQTKEQAMQIYLASVMAIDPDNPSEQAYLAMLAARLGIEPALAEHLHQTMNDVAD